MFILKIILPINKINKLFYKINCIKNIEIGSRVLVPLKNKTITGIILNIYKNNNKFKNIKLKKIIKIIDKKFLLNKNILKLIIFSSKYYHCPINKILFSIIPKNINIKILKNKNNKIKKYKKKSKIFLLTKPIKINLFLTIIKKNITKKYQILIMVPKIKLLNKIKKILCFFKKKLEIITSKINKKNIIKIWEKTKNNKISIIIGTRSSIFTPFNNLGLIFIFEEHSNLYKEKKTWIYNAKNLSLIRSKIENNTVILKSNTPSTISLYNLKKKIYKKFKIKKNKNIKYNNKIYIYKKNIKKKIFINKIIKFLKKKKHILIITNNLFNKYKLKCKNCNIYFKCIYCNKTLILNKKIKYIKCLFCKKINLIKKNCNICKTKIKIKKKIFKKYIKKFFYFIYKIKKKLNFNKKLINFSNNFKNYEKKNKLIIIYIIDKYLISENYKSIEIFIQKYFQYLEIINFKYSNKEIIFKTKYPNNYIFKKIIKNNYKKIIFNILKERKIINYPPYSYESIIRLKKIKNNKLYIWYKIKKTILKNKKLIKFFIINLNKNYYFYKYKWNIIIQSKLRKNLHKFIKKIKKKFNKYNLNYKIDIDL